MLHEGPSAPHLFLNHAMRLRFQKRNRRTVPESTREIATRVQKRGCERVEMTRIAIQRCSLDITGPERAVPM